MVLPRRTFKVALCLAGFFACTLVTCVTKPSGADASMTITLALEIDGRIDAIYSGYPIEAIVTLPEAVVDSAIGWHLGSAFVLPPDSMRPGSQVTHAVYRLYWSAFPTHRIISGDTSFFDSVYVSVGGGRLRSNSVKITVRNIAPEIKTVTIGTKVITARTAPLVYEVDTAKSIAIRVLATDVNDKVLNILWNSASAKLVIDVPSNPWAITYTPPLSGVFTDTIFCKVMDANGGNDTRALIMHRGAANLPPVFDSIVCGDTTFKSSSLLLRYQRMALDTIKMRVYASDPEAQIITFAYKVKKPLNFTADTAGKVRYYTSTTHTTLIDSLAIIDTLRITVRDAKGDSAVRQIEVVHGNPIIPPVIDSIRVKGILLDSVFRGADTLYRIQNPVLDTIFFQGYATDSDTKFGDTIAYSWIMRSKSLSMTSRLTYVSPDSASLDTIYVSAADKRNRKSIRKKIIITVQ